MAYIFKLTDIAESDQHSKVEILQTKTFRDFYFIGVYSKSVGDKRDKMDELKVINKKDNLLLQVVEFTKISTDSGNILTIIFNVGHV